MWTSMRSSSGRRRRGSPRSPPKVGAYGRAILAGADASAGAGHGRRIRCRRISSSAGHRRSAAQGPMKGEPLRRTAPYFVHPRFTRNGPLRQTVAAARSVEDKQGKHDDDEDNCFRSAGSRLTRASGVGSQRRRMRGRSIPGGMRRSAWRSRRSSWLRLRLSWRGCCAACLWRTLLLARRRSRLPLTGY
jgi:hypothetical protein